MMPGRCQIDASPVRGLNRNPIFVSVLGVTDKREADRRILQLVEMGKGCFSFVYVPAFGAFFTAQVPNTTHGSPSTIFP